MASEKRLIPESEREHLIRCLKRIHDADFTPGVYEHSVYGRAAMFLEETADAVEVVHGRWLNGTKSFRSGSIFAGYCCSVCDEFSVRNSNYCSNCGAVMDGGNEDV